MCEMNEFQAYLQNAKQAVETALDEMLPRGDVPPADLHSAMRYSVLGGGKRLRGILCMASCEAVGGMRESARSPAAALEILHAYTLVHDDLPAMDDDDLRRGKPSTHRKFGEAEAILAGDALLTFAFELLAWAETGVTRMVAELARAAGSRGVIGGQYEDISCDEDKNDPGKLEYIHTHKTADLIAAACKLGGLAGEGREEEIAALGNYGSEIGLAFQIVDDVLDETSTTDKLGKPIGSDRDNSKVTAVSFYGLEQSRKRARNLVESAKSRLSILSGDVANLVSLADLVLSRDR